MITPARHVFHEVTSQPDTITAWIEACAEPSFTWGSSSAHSFRSVKRDFNRWLQDTKDIQLTIYHDGAGADALGGADPSSHKVFFLHHWYPRWKGYVEWMIRHTGKLLVSSSAEIDRIKDEIPWIPRKHIHQINSPGLHSTLAGGQGSGAKMRTGIWLHGQSWKTYGNRLRGIVDRWTEDLGELEIIAEGNKQPSWSKKNKVIWSKNLPLEFALMRLHTWDSTLLINNYNLDRPWLKEAVRLECFPLVPDAGDGLNVSSWKDEAAPKPYPWGDIPAAISLLKEWRKSRQENLPSFQQWCKSHGLATFSPQEWNTVKKEIISGHAPKLIRHKPVSNWTFLKWYERILRLRCGY